jgi:hypothetical protein
MPCQMALATCSCTLEAAAAKATPSGLATRARPQAHATSVPRPKAAHASPQDSAPFPARSYDVLVTNPPYSADHKERALGFCLASAKPWLLLLPNYVAGELGARLLSPVLTPYTYTYT